MSFQRREVLQYLDDDIALLLESFEIIVLKVIMVG